MMPYRNINGNSGVKEYEIGDDYIAVKFYSSPKVYIYSYRKAGQYHVDQMKCLAQNGNGLNRYINNYVKMLYD